MSGKNTIVRGGGNARSLFPSAKALVASGVSQNLNQGDLVILDTTNHRLALPSAEADGAHFLGVQAVTLVDGKLPSPYSTDVDGSRASDDVPGPLFGMTAKVVLKSGDTVHAGDPVYLYPSAVSGNTTAWKDRMVQAAGTKVIGYAQAGLTGDGTAEVEILVICSQTAGNGAA